MQSYLAGDECGNITKAQWIDGKLIDLDSESADLGAYYEFMLSGAVPKSGVIPKPDMMVSGKDMMKPYRTATTNAKRVKAYLETMGLKIVSSGKKLTKGRFEGTIDLIVECTISQSFSGIKWNFGDRFVIDLKYSGLLEDKWNKFGWKWSNIQKEYYGIQAKHYHLVSGLPFYYLVCSSTNEEDVKMFYIPIDQDMLDRHIEQANKLFEAFELEREIGFIPRPEVGKCLKCPLNADCKDKRTFPYPEIVDLTIETFN